VNKIASCVVVSGFARAERSYSALRRSRTQEKITAAPGCATARSGCAAGRSAGVSRVAAASGARAAVYSKLAMI
jgi:hypothetical protein